MQNFKDMTDTSLNVFADTAAGWLMASLKGRLISEVQRSMANQAIEGGYDLAKEIGRRANHRSTGWQDPMPDFGRGFADAERAIAYAIREAAASIGREQYEATLNA